jgi:hypothetical protein
MANTLSRAPQYLAPALRTAIKRKAIENVYEKPIKIIRKELSSIEDFESTD